MRAARQGYSLVLQHFRSVGVVKIRVGEMFVLMQLGEYKYACESVQYTLLVGAVAARSETG